jgi:hypothetical protein
VPMAVLINCRNILVSNSNMFQTKTNLSNVTRKSIRLRFCLFFCLIHLQNTLNLLCWVCWYINSQGLWRLGSNYLAMWSWLIVLSGVGSQVYLVIRMVFPVPNVWHGGPQINSGFLLLNCNHWWWGSLVKLLSMRRYWKYKFSKTTNNHLFKIGTFMTPS